MPTGPRPRLRVHVLIDSLNWGGAETLLAEYATAAQGAGHEVTVAHLSDRPGAEERLRERGIEPELLGVHGLVKRSNRTLVRDHLARVDPDVLHTHLGYSDFYGGLAARSLGLATVATLHTMEDPDGPRDWVKERLMAAVRRHCAHRVITVSEAQRKHYLGLGWDRPEHVAMVHNGIVGAVEAGRGRAIREELGIGPEELVVAMLSVLRGGKGHDIAFRAVSELRERLPDLRLLVLGEGPARAEIEAQAAPLGERVLMTGHRDDVVDVLDAVDILIHPSSIDAFPTALMEAMAARVPVVATAVGGIPEIVVDGETGLLIEAPPRAGELAAGIERLAADPDERARFGAAGRRRFDEEFSAEAWIAKLTGIYEDAIASARGVAA